MASMLLTYSCLINAVVAATSDNNDSSRCDHDGDLMSLLQSPGLAASAGSAKSMAVQDGHIKVQTQQPLKGALDIGAEQHPAMEAAIAATALGGAEEVLVQQTQHINLVSVDAARATGAGAWLIPLAIGFCIVAAILCTVVACRSASESVANAMEFENKTSPVARLDLKRQVSSEDPFPDDVFSKRGVDLPRHLSTKKGRWKSLIIIAVMNSLTSGPAMSWPTFEPILKDEGVFAGPHQASQLNLVYSMASAIALMAAFVGGITFDAVGPRATSAAGAFLVAANLVGMAIGTQFQSLNFLICFCYPATAALGGLNLLGGYAWLQLLPDFQSTVSAIINGFFFLTGSCALIAVFMHNNGVSLPVYFAVNAFFAFLAGIADLMIIPERTIFQEVALVLNSVEADVQSGSDGAVGSSGKRVVESPWDIVKRSAVGVRDLCTCFLWLCPGASFLFFCFIYSLYMIGLYPTIIMLQFYEALLGPASAVTLVNAYSVSEPFVGAFLVVVTGLCSDYAGFATSCFYCNFAIVLQFALFCVPSVAVQIVGQGVNAWMTGIVFLLVPRWCLSYVPLELYGTAFGFLMAAVGVLQLITAPLATTVGTHLNELATDYSHPAVAYLISIGLFCLLAITSSLAYLQFMWFYPMPASGGTTMIEVTTRTKGAKEV